jgi:hypothetical protein
MGASCAIEIDSLTSNNFAFGGINTSLIFRRDIARWFQPVRSCRG